VASGESNGRGRRQVFISFFGGAYFCTNSNACTMPNPQPTTHITIINHNPQLTGTGRGRFFPPWHGRDEAAMAKLR
jgi:hypothetical protein